MFSRFIIDVIVFIRTKLAYPKEILIKNIPDYIGGYIGEKQKNMYNSKKSKKINTLLIAVISTMVKGLKRFRVINLNLILDK